MADVLERNNVARRGLPTSQPMLFAHGFGCDQHMWRFVALAFERDYSIVLFDDVGSGQSDLGAYDPVRYQHLDGYARDVLEIVEALDLRDVIRRPLGQLDDRGARGGPSAGALRQPGARRALGAISERRRVPRRHQRGRHRKPACRARQQLPRVVGRDGSRDHGEPGAARTRHRAHRQLLPHRSGDPAPLRPRHVPLRQPRRSRPGALPHARPAVLERRHRARGRRSLRSRRDRRQRGFASPPRGTAPT